MYLWKYFHREWGKAKDRPDYNKKAWMLIQTMLERLGCPDQVPADLAWLVALVEQGERPDADPAVIVPTIS